MLESLAIKVEKMNDTLATGMTAENARNFACPDHSPQCRAKAASRLQKLEKNLNNEQKVAILDLFETSTAAADMFLAVDKDNEGLQWAWLSKKLKQMGHPPLPSWDSVDV